MTAFCAKHKAEYDKWSDWGPWNPRPRTISQATVDSQLALIKTAHENGHGCSTTPPQLRYTIVDKDSNEQIHPGAYVRDFHGETWVFLSVSREPVPGKSAKVFVESLEGDWQQEFYAKVFNIVVTDNESEYTDRMI
jgi:hypothetical protein